MNTKIDTSNGEVNATPSHGFNVSGPDVLFVASNPNKNVGSGESWIEERLRRSGGSSKAQAVVEGHFDSTDAAKAGRGLVAPVVHYDTFGMTEAEDPNDLLTGLAPNQQGSANLGSATVGITETGLEGFKVSVTLQDRDAIEALRDVVSHHTSWRAALVKCYDAAKAENNDADASYYQHEINALDRVNAGLRNVPLPNWKNA